ncbi:hypothetical protein RRG08_008763 [Elysia crispata]|uniref:Uncharacterized protein n=1 Tax=Elysia crispata TaxID=231223 RepID=A0AAE1CMY6_9GAST|nr:hypothetical protein RRG08_008763 [Elysia crispata]
MWNWNYLCFEMARVRRSWLLDRLLAQMRIQSPSARSVVAILKVIKHQLLEKVLRRFVAVLCLLKSCLMATFVSGDPTSVCSLCSLAAAVDKGSSVNRFMKSCEGSEAPLLPSPPLHSSFLDPQRAHPHLAQSSEAHWAPLLPFEHGLGDRQTSPSGTRGFCGVTSKQRFSGGVMHRSEW